MESMKLIFFFLLLLTRTLTSSAQKMAKPGCPEECGGVKIPFPFGTQEGCFYSTQYQITCNTTTKTPFPTTRQYDGDSLMPVLTIDLENHTLRVSNQVAFVCYNSSAKIELRGPLRPYYTFNAAPFANSPKNKLVGVGCDTTARVGDDDRTSAYFTGCMTSCLAETDVNQGECSGMGCCEASIPPGIYMPYVNVDSIANHVAVEGFNPCSFAFVSEGGGYNLSLAALNYSAVELRDLRVSALLDWAISGRGNCSGRNDTQSRNIKVLCGVNAHCVDAFVVEDAYRCRCSDGYSGNPYLPNGCQDIDECLDGRLNKCEGEAKCVNKEGGYDCRCPNGYTSVGSPTTTCVPILPHPNSAPNKFIVLGLSISLGSILALFFLFGLYKVMKRRKDLKEREHNFNRNGGLLLKQQFSASDGAVERTKIFSRSDLEKATNNFNENRILGRGGQGTVYKGMLEDGVIVAVKKSKKVDENQLAQFINEVVILSQVNHRNVVQIFGCCLETEVPMLVYEFVPNGTLYQHIHNPSEDFHITWKMRFQIAVECAGALAYLHSSSSCPIYHRDIKSSNILLDEKYKAKIADFGTSKTISIDQTHVTTCVQGTFGYLDPEFFQSSQFTEKSDVYSFGVVLLELLTSKKPISTDKDKESRSLTSDFLQLGSDELHRILDTTILHDCPEEEIQALANLTRRCLSLNGKHRPTMQEVVMALQMIRSKQYQVVNSQIEQNLEGGEGYAWSDVMKMVEDSGDASYTSAYPDESFSIQVHPLLFDSN